MCSVASTDDVTKEKTISQSCKTPASIQNGCTDECIHKATLARVEQYGAAHIYQQTEPTSPLSSLLPRKGRSLR
jgi:hypothetical protein